MKRILCVLLSAFALFAFVSCEKETQVKNDAAATVNGEIITTAETEYFRKKYKSQVLNDYLEKYSVQYTEDFWQTEFDGKTPEQELNERVLEECVKAKLQFILMKEEGIYEDITFEALRLKAEAFNEENKNKEGIVGIKSIRMSQFYTYYLQTGIMQLQNIYAEGKLKPTEKEIENKISEFKGGLDSAHEQDFESIAVSKLKTEKYEKYIEELYENAEIRELT